MKKEIELNQYRGFLRDREPLLFEDGETLELTFSGPYRLDNAFLAISSGNKKERKIRIEDVTTIPDDYLIAGELNLEVIFTARGQVVKRIRVEPILIRELDGTLSAVPEIDAMKAEIATLTEKCAGLVEEFSAYKKAVSGQFTAVIEAHNKMAEQVKVLLEEQAL